jgi:hypothetical protein
MIRAVQTLLATSLTYGSLPFEIFYYLISFFVKRFSFSFSDKEYSCQQTSTPGQYYTIKFNSTEPNYSRSLSVYRSGNGSCPLVGPELVFAGKMREYIELFFYLLIMFLNFVGRQGVCINFGNHFSIGIESCTTNEMIVSSAIKGANCGNATAYTAACESTASRTIELVCATSSSAGVTNIRLFVIQLFVGLLWSLYN